MKKKPKQQRKVNRGRRPDDTEILRMRGLGYAMPGKVAEELGIRPTTLYTWIAAGKLETPHGTIGEDGRPLPPTYKRKGVVWVLLAAAQAKVALPGTAAS